MGQPRKQVRSVFRFQVSILLYQVLCSLNLPTNLDNIMGGCAGKPKDLDHDEAPATVEAPVTPEKKETQTVPQEKKDDETKEEPLVELSEPAPEAAKIEEVTPATEAKSILEENVQVEAEKPAEAVEVAKEEKKEVEETVA